MHGIVTGIVTGISPAGVICYRNRGGSMLQRICALTLFAAAAFAADLTGSWQLAVQTSQGPGSPTLVLQQHGESLTGTYNSQVFGEAKITGSVKGNIIEFAFQGDAGGQTIKVTYTGTIESPTSMKGTAIYAGFDDKATWVATRK
jgi:hypothetical protein